MTDNWLKRGNQPYTLSDDDVLILEGASLIAEFNPPARKDRLLKALMQDFWKRSLPMFSLRPQWNSSDSGVHYERNEHGHFVKTIRQDPSLHEGDFSLDDAGIITLECQRTDWSPESLLFGLRLLNRQGMGGVGPEYQSGPVTWDVLAGMDPISYDPEGLRLPLLRASATDLADWCWRNGFKNPPIWEANKPIADKKSNTTGAEGAPAENAASTKYGGLRLLDQPLVDRAVQLQKEHGVSLWAALRSIPDDQLPGSGTPDNRRRRILLRIPKAEKLLKTAKKN